MSDLILRLNDADLRLIRAQKILAEDVGYAYQKDDLILTGREAEARSRLEPLHTHSKFWRQLHGQHLLTAIGSQQSAADFAYQQILHLWREGAPKEKQLTLVIPSNLSAEHASLLLGIATACPFEVLALVDVAIAEVAGYDKLSSKQPIYHLDMHLHTSLLTEIHLKEGQYQRAQVHEIPVGVTHLKAALMKEIARDFMQSARFDPLHTAESEQALYDQLADVAQGGTARIATQDASGEHKLSVESLAPALQQSCAPITQALQARLGDGGQLLIAHSLAPWMRIVQPWLEGTGYQTSVLDTQPLIAGVRQALAETANQHAHPRDDIPWVTHLPAPHPAEISTQSSPTHLLIHHQAFALKGTLSLGLRDGEGFSTTDGDPLGRIQAGASSVHLTDPHPKLALNGKPIHADEITLQCGDTLSYAKHSAHCILVEAG